MRHSQPRILTTFVMIAAMALSLPGAIAQLDESLIREAQASIGRGVTYLLDQQQENGSWLDEPSITGLTAVALHQSQNKDHAEAIEKAVGKAREYILQFARDSGAIAKPDSHYVNYTTSISLVALAILNDPQDHDVMRRARHYLMGMQLDEDHPEHPTSPDNPFYGGIGYGSGGPTQPDLSNTQWALEALHLTDHLDRDTEKSAESELAWDNALEFLKAVQNVPKDAGPTWVVSEREDPNNDGGFIYHPKQSKVNEKMTSEDATAAGLRSYGSMTYAGLKSMIYADVDKDDYRVKAAVDWASRHYTLDENPIMGPEGHYYYLQTFAKALDAFGEDTLKAADGTVYHWRADLVLTILELQKQDGQWFNEKNGRWMESIPELVTAYALIAMEVALGEELQ